MLALLVVHPLLRVLYERLRGQSQPADHSTQLSSADDRLERRLRFDFAFAILFLTVLHGTSALKVLLILYINFSIATKLPPNYVVPATWVFGVGTLFANELSGGYPYHKIAAFVSPGLGEDIKENWGSLLDHYSGLVTRWEVLFNITVLRMISFNVDYHWSRGHSASNSLEVRLPISDHALLLKRTRRSN